MNIESFKIDTEGGKVNGDIYYKNFDDESPVLIVSHGFKAYREWGFFPYICRKIAENNIIVVNIDFSLNGIKDPEKGLFDVEKFRKNTVSQEVEDLNKVIDNLESILSDAGLINWTNELYLLGHSLGGAVSIITASYRDDINKLVTWASIGDIDRNTERQKKHWRENGVIEFENQVTGQTLLLDVEYLEDKMRNIGKYDLEERISKLDIPILIVHGEKDFTVRIKEAELLDNAAGDNAELYIVEKTGHTFNIRHPFKESNEFLDNALNKTIEFLVD